MNAKQKSMFIRIAFAAILAATAIVIVLPLNLSVNQKMLVVASVLVPYIVALTVNNHWAIQTGLGLALAIAAGMGFGMGAPDAASEFAGIMVGIGVFVGWFGEMIMEAVSVFVISMPEPQAEKAAEEEETVETEAVEPMFNRQYVDVTAILYAMLLTGGAKSPLAALLGENAKHAEAWLKQVEAEMPDAVKKGKELYKPAPAAQPAAAKPAQAATITGIDPARLTNLLSAFGGDEFATFVVSKAPFAATKGQATIKELMELKPSIIAAMTAFKARDDKKRAGDTTQSAAAPVITGAVPIGAGSSNNGHSNGSKS